MKVENNIIPTSYLDLCIETGNSDGFLGSLADAKLSPDQIKEVLARMAEAEAKQYDFQAKEVIKNLRGLDKRIAGDNSFELDRAQNLRNLAETFRKL